jgi:hypothetical protein
LFEGSFFNGPVAINLERNLKLKERVVVHFNVKKVKVKVTLIQALRFCADRTAYRGSGGIALPFHYNGTRWG